jgi:hypothetical protein
MVKLWVTQLKSDKYKHLVDILLLAAIGQFILMVVMLRRIIPESNLLFDSLIRISGIIMTFLQGCACLVIIVRREFRQIITIRGRAAQIIGFLLWIVNWGLMIYIFMYEISVN